MINIRDYVWPAPDDGMLLWVRRFLDQAEARSWLSKATLCSALKNRLEIRDWFARKHLRGRGIELGAQQVPTNVGQGCRVEYVDVVSNETLVALYGLPVDELVPLAHVIDGNDLSVYADGALDFVIANHVLEHFDDPVGGLREWMRIVKDGGYLFITLPNFRGNCYDFERPPVRRDHLDLDHRDAEGRPARNFQHYVDICRTLYQITDPVELDRQAQEWVDADLRQHYHVYDVQSVRDVVSLAAEASLSGLRYVDGLLSPDGFEFLMVLEKRSSGGLLGWPSSMQRLIGSLRCHAMFCDLHLVRAYLLQMVSKRRS